MSDPFAELGAALERLRSQGMVDVKFSVASGARESGDILAEVVDILDAAGATMPVDAFPEKDTGAAS